MKRIDDIEFLRAIAILFTLAAHLPLLIGQGLTLTQIHTVMTFGGGVDLFFVISGFVITRSLMDKGGDFRSFAFNFWIRRAWRLLPAAWLWLLLPLLAIVYFNKSGIFGALLPNLYDAAAGFLQVANIHFHLCQHEGIGQCTNGGYPFGLYWSLSLEEQFYVLFPFVLFFTPRRYLAWLLGAAVLAQLFLPRVGTMLWEIRTDALLIGALIALKHDALRKYELKHAKVIAMLLIAALAVIPQLPVGYTTGLLALASGGLVFIASFDRNHFPQAQWLGSRSYTLYLVHLPIFCLAHELWYRVWPSIFLRAYEVPIMLTAAVLMYAFAEATYRGVEMPLRKRGHDFSYRPRQTTQPSPQYTGSTS